MHHDLFKLAGNTLLFLLLLSILILPVSSVTIMSYSSNNAVLSAQNSQPMIQLPQKEVIRNNAIRLTKEKQNEIQPIEETTESTETTLSEQGQ